MFAYSKAHEQRAAANLHNLHISNLSRTRERDSAFTPVLRRRDPSREKSVTRAEWSVQPAVQGNGGLTNAVRAAEDGGILENNVLRIGTLGFPTDDLGLAKRDEITEKLESEYDSISVIVSDKHFDGHYRQYCKTILWPVLHYQIPDHPKSKAYEDHSWIYYVKINEAFAEKVVQSYKRGDVIWIHDYHLLLLPSMIRKKLPDARIGFFLHTAFPSSEVFRCLAVRKQLLEGMLGADLVVFQTSEYAHHFLETCSRLLVVETTEHGVQLDDHFVDVDHCPIGIVADQLSAARSNPEVESWIQILAKKYEGKTLIVGRDKLDSIRGVKQKLLAFEMFLNENPEWCGRIVLIQVATSTASDQKSLDNRVSDIVTRVNAKHSTLDHQPVVFLKQDIAFHQYLALLSAADVLMVTSLREGMNLTCHEYINCQDGRQESGKKYGPVILSEFAGAAEVFAGNEIAVNPWDYKQMARAIKHSIEMSDEQKHKRYHNISQLIAIHTGINWIKELQFRLNAAYEKHQQRDMMSIPRLSIKKLSEAFYQSSTALFILDFGGTLCPPGTSCKTFLSSPQRVVDVLNDLVAMPGNVVYVSSARKKEDMEQCFAQVPGLGLIAENGCFVRRFQSEHWLDLANTSPENKAEWKEGVLSLLDYYVQRQKGSYVEEREYSVVYHYEDVPDGEAEAAIKQAGDAANHINDSCQAQRMKAVPLDRAVVIEPYDVDKATAADWVLRQMCRTSFHVNEGNEETANGKPADYFQDRSIVKDDANELAASLEQVSITQPRKDSMSVVSDMPSPPTAPDIFIRTQTVPPPPSAASHTPSPPLDPDRVPGFLLVAGDDRDDEPVFRWANSLRQQKGSIQNGSRGGSERGGSEADAESAVDDSVCRIKDVFSVCVGKKNTEASCTLTQGATGLLAALERLTSA